MWWTGSLDRRRRRRRRFPLHVSGAGSRQGRSGHAVDHLHIQTVTRLQLVGNPPIDAATVTDTEH